jgi:hypothetical protein
MEMLSANEKSLVIGCIKSAFGCSDATMGIEAEVSLVAVFSTGV